MAPSEYLAFGYQPSAVSPSMADSRWLIADSIYVVPLFSDADILVVRLLGRLRLGGSAGAGSTGVSGAEGSGSLSISAEPEPDSGDLSTDSTNASKS